MFLLDSIVASVKAPVAWQVKPDIFSGHHGPWPFWYVGRGDTVHVVWSTGFQGVDLMLVQHGDTLRGEAHMFTDVESPLFPNPHALVIANRVDCRAMGEIK
jgi:hypothetical protein